MYPYVVFILMIYFLLTFRIRHSYPSHTSYAHILHLSAPNAKIVLFYFVKEKPTKQKGKNYVQVESNPFHTTQSLVCENKIRSMGRDILDPVFPVWSKILHFVINKCCYRLNFINVHPYNTLNGHPSIKLMTGDLWPTSGCSHMVRWPLTSKGGGLWVRVKWGLQLRSGGCEKYVCWMFK